MANAIRALSMDAVEAAKSGHPGMPMGMADAATVLFTRHLKFDAANPQWPDRDRFVLSAGHGSMLLYSLLHLTGYPDITLDDIKRFRQLGSPVRRASRIRPCAGRRNDDRAAGPGYRHGGRHGAGRADPQRALRRRSGRSPHLCHRLRRRSDGRHQPRSQLAGRAFEAATADRAVRRQRDLDRRADEPRGVGRRREALRGGGLDGDAGRRTRSGGGRSARSVRPRRATSLSSSPAARSSATARRSRRARRRRMARRWARRKSPAARRRSAGRMAVRNSGRYSRSVECGGRDAAAPSAKPGDARGLRPVRCEGVRCSRWQARSRRRLALLLQR